MRALLTDPKDRSHPVLFWHLLSSKAVQGILSVLGFKTCKTLFISVFKMLTVWIGRQIRRQKSKSNVMGIVEERDSFQWR